MTSVVCGHLCSYSVVDCKTGHFWQVYHYPVWVLHGTFSSYTYVCGNSILWWHSRLIWVAWGSPDTFFMCLSVAFELSYFLANWCTLLAGNLSKSTLPSLMVLETKSSSFRKKQNMSLCSILAVSRGIWLSSLVPAWHCTTHPHCSFLVGNSSVNQIWPRPCWIVVCNILCISPI